MKAGEGASDLVQYHPTPGSSKDSGVVEAEVSPPKEPQDQPKKFPSKFIGVSPIVTREELDEGLQHYNETVRSAAFKLPIVTREELDEGLQHYNETVRSAAFKLHMLIASGRYTKDQALQLEQSFLEVYNNNNNNNLFFHSLRWYNSCT